MSLTIFVQFQYADSQKKSMFYGRNRYHRTSISFLNLVFDEELTLIEIGEFMGSNKFLAADNENRDYKVQFGTFEPRFEDATSFSCENLLFFSRNR